jgi:protein TonB
MQQERDPRLTSRGRFAIALVAAISLHGAVLAQLTGMRISEPRQPRIMVGMLIKAPEPKPAEQTVQAPAPPAPETPPDEPPTHQPMEQPVVAEQTPPAPAVRAKPVVSKKPLPRVKPIKKARPQKAVKPVAQTTSSNTAMTAPSTLVSDTPPANAVSPPQFHADYLHNPQPRYPLMSRKRHEVGEVLLRVRVDAQGHPETVKIHTSSGHSRLDLAASSAVQEWRFVPARQGGLNVAAWVAVPIQFNLEK